LISCGEKKRPGGKLVRVCVRVEAGRIRGILITGDFFAEPDEAFERLLEGLREVDASPEEAQRLLEEAMAASGVEIHGAGVEEALEALKRALAPLTGGRAGG